VAVKDQLESVSNVINAALIKSSHQNTIIRARIPDRVSEQNYVVKVENENNGDCLANEDCFLNLTTSEGISIRKEIFNTGDNYNIKGAVRSSDNTMEVRNIDNNIQLLGGI